MDDITTMYEVDGKQTDILKEDWDFLIILDACRYDYFKGGYNKYIKEGNLKKAVSPGIHTMDLKHY